MSKDDQDAREVERERIEREIERRRKRVFELEEKVRDRSSGSGRSGLKSSGTVRLWSAVLSGSVERVVDELAKVSEKSQTGRALDDELAEARNDLERAQKRLEDLE